MPDKTNATSVTYERERNLLDPTDLIQALGDKLLGMETRNYVTEITDEDGRVFRGGGGGPDPARAAEASQEMASERYQWSQAVKKHST